MLLARDKAESNTLACGSARPVNPHVKLDPLLVVPNDVTRVRVTVTCRSCDQALGCPELKQKVCVGRRSCSKLRAFGNKLFRTLLPHPKVIDALRKASQVEGVLVVLTRK